MDNKSRDDAEQESAKEEVSRRAIKDVEGGSSVFDSRIGIDFPIRNYRLSPREVKVLVYLLRKEVPQGFEAYEDMAAALEKQLNRWIEYYYECENAKEKDIRSAGI